MRTVGLAEAKAQLLALLDAVEAGDEVVITRRGHAVARLIASQQRDESIEGPSSWAKRFRELNAGAPTPKRTAFELVREIREEPFPAAPPTWTAAYFSLY